MQDLKSKLLKLWERGALSHASLIITNKLEATQSGIMSFINDITSRFSSVNSFDNPDVVLISFDDPGKPLIKIDRIRDLQNVFSSKSGISPYKFGIINGAEYLNLNAANSLLKLLEDTPKNSYLLLITEKPYSIISTILSRCVKIYVNEGEREVLTCNIFEEIADKNISNSNKIRIIEEFACDKSTGNHEKLALLKSAALVFAKKLMSKQGTHSDIMLKILADSSKLIDDVSNHNLDILQIIMLIFAKIHRIKS
ncbi:MAG: hypothetical protein SFT93_03380 [Rickettsiaceae bacterium]|nr:hypothetical protein [Rickettsiaceae bacterium]